MADQAQPAAAQTQAEPAVPAEPAAFDCSAVSEIPLTECQALVALYNSTNGANWNNKGGWLATNTPCSWYGVACTAGHVTNLSLSYNQLSGSIPPQLGNLANLQELFLDHNPLSGALPYSLTNLSLEYFYFDNTNLCEPGDAVFQAWLAGIPNLRRTGIICQPSSATRYLPLLLRAR